MPFKRKKSKNQPKQPDTAYICYWKSKRMELLSENPDMEPTLVSKEVGRHWKSLSEEERQVWWRVWTCTWLHIGTNGSVALFVLSADLERHVGAGQVALPARDR